MWTLSIKEERPKAKLTHPLVFTWGRNYTAYGVLILPSLF